MLRKHCGFCTFSEEMKYGATRLTPSLSSQHNFLKQEKQCFCPTSDSKIKMTNDQIYPRTLMLFRANPFMTMITFLHFKDLRISDPYQNFISSQLYRIVKNVAHLDQK